MTSLSFDAWLTLIVIASILVLLIRTRISADILFFSGLGMLLLAGVVDVRAAMSGFSNPGVITIALLYVVISGLQHTGGLNWVVHHVLGRPTSELQGLVRVMLPTTVLSAFLNNTPVVAMFIPAVSKWSRKMGLHASRLLIPLSYASIFGGICTLIGTSTNLVVNGMMVDRGLEGLGMFEITKVGVPCAVVGTLYLLFIGRHILPKKGGAGLTSEDPREYTVEMVVPQGSTWAGRSVQDAGLRHLPGGYLVELIRGDQVISGVSPEEILQEGDQLIFVGVVESIMDLHKTRGLEVAPQQRFKLDTPHWERILIEAVVSPSCSAAGRSIRDSEFRTRYNGVVLAVSRNGKRIEGKIGDIILTPGDTLLLEAHRSFVDQQKNSRDFYLVSEVPDSEPPRTDRAWLAVGVLGVMVLTASFGWLSLLEAALAAAGVMLLTGCTTVRKIRQQIEWPVLILIASALGVGQAFEQSGAAQVIADGVFGLASSPWMALLIIYLLTSLFTECISNAAAAVLVFPIAFDTALSLGVETTPFIIAVMVAASSSFSTPIGYQTNLMVYGPGGYRFSDYFKTGIGLNFLFALITVGLAPWIWGW